MDRTRAVVLTLALLPACASEDGAALFKDAHLSDAENGLRIDSGVVVIDSGVIADDGASTPDADPIDSGESDSGAIDSGLTDDSGPNDSGVRDGGNDDCPLGPLFFENFERYTAGSTLAAPWATTSTLGGLVRINLESEGAGTSQAPRFLIFTLTSTPADLMVTMPPVDLTRCTRHLITIDSRFVPIGINAMNDAVRIEASPDGRRFVPIGNLFPGTAFMTNSCLPGTQYETGGGCVPWGSFGYAVPAMVFGPAFTVRFRFTGDGAGSIGFDDLAITVR